MVEREEASCESCGDLVVAALVQHGSYFTRCTACREEGPATSWLALSQHLSGKVKAVAVGAVFETLEVVAQGEVRQVAHAISQAAGEGKLIRLFQELTGV